MHAICQSLKQSFLCQGIMHTTSPATRTYIIPNVMFAINLSIITCPRRGAYVSLKNRLLAAYFGDQELEETKY
ncbi:hypothetical protein QJS10_CPA03g01753 [Acorus calamus]|uniref:Uncharacterized protein n=1 Tax=Acorus calamus TaxID=4465 RepID=A0AAV9FAF7_ACOCL|nr:hypothetical protein QJS10_CPA03g01753 [Acorus calamus]